MNKELETVLRRAESRFPGLVNRLWTSNVIHGEDVLRLAPRRRAVFPSDAGDCLRELAEHGVVEPAKFAPSHSGAAFLGLDPAYRRLHTEPNAGTAGHWAWRVVKDCTKFAQTLHEEKVRNETRMEQEYPLGCRVRYTDTRGVVQEGVVVKHEPQPTWSTGGWLRVRLGAKEEWKVPMNRVTHRQVDELPWQPVKESK